MKRIAFALAGLALASQPASALAQTFTITPTQVRLGDTVLREMGDADVAPINTYSLQDCQDNVTIRFGVPTDTSLIAMLDLWRGNSTGSNCEEAGNRNNNTQTNCFDISSAGLKDATNPFFEARLADIADGLCDEGDSISTIELYAFNTTNIGGGELNGIDWGVVQLVVDPEPPTAPEVPTTSFAGTRLSIRVTAPPGTMNPTYRFAMDTDVGPDCASGVDLDPGEAFPDDDGTFVLGNETDPNASVSVNLDAIEAGEYAAVFVSALDQADNLSPLSEMICVEKVTTMGFCDSSPDACPDGCHVSTPGLSDAPLTLPSLGALAIGGVLLLRRRKGR